MSASTNQSLKLEAALSRAWQALYTASQLAEGMSYTNVANDLVDIAYHVGKLQDELTRSIRRVR